MAKRNASSLLKEITSLTLGEKLSSINSSLLKLQIQRHKSKTIPHYFHNTNDIKTN